ncbi:MAG: hypothetical protein F9K40_18810, partial [Kofleriaceae bacterium]
DNKALGRDCNSDPYAGESAVDANARAKAAQSEVLNRLKGLEPCFVAGTPVLTADGPLPIEQIQLGARVLAMDPADPGSVRGYEVLELYRGVTNVLCRVRLGAQTITTTLNHRFYVVDVGWVRAGELLVGQPLLTPAGDLVAVDEVTVESLDHDVDTYNMHVAEVSTYFVGGDLPVLVHNADPNFDRELWWVFGKKGAKDGPAKFRPTDTDGVSVWKTESKQDVEDMFRIRRGIDGRSSSDPHTAYTPKDLADAGVTVQETPGDGSMNGRLQHGSARPTDAPAGDPLSEAQIKQAVDGINKATPAEQNVTPKKMGCK